jgi:hypothetical protein
MNLWLILAGTCLTALFAPVAVAADAAPAVPRPLADPFVLEQLRKAEETFGTIRRQSMRPMTNLPSVDTLKSNLNVILQKIPQAFQLLPPPAGTPQATFQKISLNQNALGFDAIRIRNPHAEPRKLAWACSFKASSPVEAWYILPVTGTMTGFSRYYALPPDLQNVPWNGATKSYKGKAAPVPYKGFCQALDTPEIQPGAEYIIWFAFTSSRTQEFFVRFDFPPANADLPDEKAIMKLLHLE